LDGSFRYDIWRHQYPGDTRSLCISSAKAEIARAQCSNATVVIYVLSSVPPDIAACFSDRKSYQPGTLFRHVQNKQVPRSNPSTSIESTLAVTSAQSIEQMPRSSKPFLIGVKGNALKAGKHTGLLDVIEKNECLTVLN